MKFIKYFLLLLTFHCKVVQGQYNVQFNYDEEANSFPGFRTIQLLNIEDKDANSLVSINFFSTTIEKGNKPAFFSRTFNVNNHDLKYDAVTTHTSDLTVDTSFKFSGNWLASKAYNFRFCLNSHTPSLVINNGKNDRFVMRGGLPLYIVDNKNCFEGSFGKASVLLRNVNVGQIEFYNDGNLVLDNSHVRWQYFYDCKNISLTTSNTNEPVENLIIRRGLLNSLDLTGHIPYIWLDETKIVDSFNSNVFPQVDSLRIDNVTFSEKASLDLGRSSNTSNKRILLSISHTDIEKIKFDYLKFKLNWHHESDADKEQLYVTILEKFRREGQIQSYDSLDVEYRQFLYLKDKTRLGWFKNWLDRNWWYYGYDKTLIASNSLILFGVVILINIVYFPYFCAVYEPENFRKLQRRLSKKMVKSKWLVSLSYLQLLPGIITYSAFIFWGIKLEIGSLKFDKWWWPLPVFFILIEYIGGIICLAYLVNLVIAKL